MGSSYYLGLAYDSFQNVYLFAWQKSHCSLSSVGNWTESLHNYHERVQRPGQAFDSLSYSFLEGHLPLDWYAKLQSHLLVCLLSGVYALAARFKTVALQYYQFQSLLHFCRFLPQQDCCSFSSLSLILWQTISSSYIWSSYFSRLCRYLQLIASCCFPNLLLKSVFQAVECWCCFYCLGKYLLERLNSQSAQFMKNSWPGLQRPHCL